MRLFAPSLAFVDLETTGTRAAADRITEIGIVRVDADAGGASPRVHEWSTLVDPEVPIPAAIQALTGITDRMVAGAPTFGALAMEVTERLADAVFIAHNARFDHGFLKHAFARSGRPFNARPLCTVRLSRRLFPDAQGGHGLDALIARHDLAIAQRHRALGDARALWAFVRMLYRQFPEDVIETAVKRLLRMPSLPPQLPPDMLDHLPETPGVYFFYGDNALPLYVGKSVNLRERIGAHFAADWRSETDLRLSQEIRRIEFEPTAGEFGALLREAALVKKLLPAHNRALRRKQEAGVLTLVAGVPKYLLAADIDPSELATTYGPFASKRGAREALRSLATEHALCWRRLGLDARTEGPCFQRQLRRCAGACTGDEPAPTHDERLRQTLGPWAIPMWPSAGLAYIREVATSVSAVGACDDCRVDVHLLRDWCWLGTARSELELHELLAAPPSPAFDVDITRMLLKRHAAGTLALVSLPDRRLTAPEETAA